MKNKASAIAHLFIGVMTLGLLLIQVGCIEPEFEVTVLPSRQVEPGGKIQMGVGARHRDTDGLRYKWAAKLGSCDPQDTDKERTTYTAPKAIPKDGNTTDSITLEIYKGDSKIDSIYVTVNIVAEAPKNATTQPPANNSNVQMPKAQPPKLRPEINSETVKGAGITGTPSITIMNQLPFDPVGGDGSQATIEGVVSGVDPKEFRIVIYAYTNAHYVQPLIAAPFTRIEDDGKWSTWTHTGTRYTVLLVRPSFVPPSKAEVLPGEGGDVIKIVTVTGKR